MKRLLFLLLITTPYLTAQVGIGTTSPNALLEIESTDQATPSNTDGILIPKINEFPASNPGANQDGMLVYATGSGSVTKGFYYWDNGSSAWVLATGAKNIDDLADGVTTGGGSSIFLGIDSGSNDDGTNNRNVGIGYGSLVNNVSGSENTSLGWISLGLNTGDENSALGSRALTSNTSGDGNTALGYNALTNNTTASYNIGIGHGSLRANTTGGSNTAIGVSSLFNNIGGSDNVALGHSTGVNIPNGNRNTFLGAAVANLTNTSISGSVFIGYNSGYNEMSSDRLYIENSNANAENALIYGEFDNDILRTNGTFQIGNPTSGGYALPVADGTTNQVLQTDGSGTVTWADSVEDIDWHEEGTTSAPNAITDEIYTLGNVAIGKNTADYTLDIQNTAGERMFNAVAAGNSDLTGRLVGSQLEVTDSGSSNLYGLYHSINGSPSGTSFGIYQDLSNNSTAATYASYNAMFNVTGSGIQYGSYNRFSNSGAGDKYGTYNIFNGSNGNNTYGIYNYLNGTASSSFYGTYNNIAGSSGAPHYGTYNLLQSNSSEQYGSYNQINSGTSGLKYASYNVVTASGGGTKFGVYSQVPNTTNSYAGYFLGTVSIGTTVSDNYLLPASRGGANEVLQTDGSGGTSWVNPSTLVTHEINDLVDGKSDNDGTNNGSSIYLGVNAGNSDDVSDNQNIGIGLSSLFSNTSGYSDTAVGYSTLRDNTTGYQNTAIGHSALQSNTTGYSNTAVGSLALQANQGGISNAAFGRRAMEFLTGGLNNTAIGTLALQNNTTGDRNTVVGSGAGLDAQGDENVIIGSLAMRYNTTGNRNTVVGSNASFNVLGDENVIIGVGLPVPASRTISKSVIIGSYAGRYETNSNRLYIENTDSTSPLIYGEFDNDVLGFNGDVGINTQSPSASLHVNHQSGSSSEGFVLSNVTDADEWRMYVQWNSNTLAMFFNNTNVGNFDDVSGTYSAISDRRMKKNIQPIGSVLERVNQLEVVDYNFVHQKDSGKYTGLIAQEVQKLFPNLVSVSDDETENLTMDYSGFGVLAIKAIQEQQQQIDELKNEIEELKALIKLTQGE